MHFFTPLLVFVAFLLSLLVSVSLPVVKSITIFTIDINITASAFGDFVSGSALGNIVFGVWGYCLRDFSIEASFGDSDFDAEGSEYCTQAKLGYTFDERFDDVINAIPGNDVDADTIRNAITAATTVAFILHVITAVLAFFTLFFTSLLCRKTGKGVPLCAVLFSLITALICTVVFLIDVIFVAVVRGRLENETDNQVTATWGNGVWMMLGATIALWLAVIGSFLACCRRRKEKY